MDFKKLNFKIIKNIGVFKNFFTKISLNKKFSVNYTNLNKLDLF